MKKESLNLEENHLNISGYEFVGYERSDTVRDDRTLNKKYADYFGVGCEDILVLKRNGESPYFYEIHQRTKDKKPNFFKKLFGKGK